MRRRIAIAALVLVAAACGGGSPPPLPTPPGGTGTPTVPLTTPPTTIPTTFPTTPTVTIRPTPHALGYQVWLELHGSLYMAIRQVSAVDAVAGAIRALFRGPTKRERLLGITTEIPKNASVKGVTESNALAVVNLSHAFFQGKDPASLSMRYAQVVQTATQFPSVNGVKFEDNGQRRRVLNGTGTAQLHSANPKNYENLMPAILVQEPVIGELVQNPLAVAGTTSLGSVSVRVLAPDGTLLASTTAANSCSGCRGQFSGTLTYFTKAKRATVQVYQVGPTGTPIHSVKIPVRLAH